jgi:hypothetical protein
VTDLDKLGAGDRDMNERNNDNPQERGFNEVEKPGDDFVPEDAWPVCPRCLTPCRPMQYYCPHCDSNEAINPLTPYIAFLNIRFNYDIFCTMWRKIWYDKRTSMIRRLFYMLMIMLFVPYMIIFGLPLLLLGIISQPRLRNTKTLLICLIAVVFVTLLVSCRLFSVLMWREVFWRIWRCV